MKLSIQRLRWRNEQAGRLQGHKWSPAHCRAFTSSLERLTSMSGTEQRIKNLTVPAFNFLTLSQNKATIAVSIRPI